MPRSADPGHRARRERSSVRALPRAMVLLAIAALVVAACGSTAPTSSPSDEPSATTLPTPSASSGPDGSASPAPSASISSEQERQLRAVADEILSQVSELRGLDLKQPVETRVLDQAGIDDWVRRSSEKEMPPEEIAAAEGAYQRLGLLGADESLKDLQQELLGSQVLGLYDDDEKQLYVVARGDAIGGLERFTMSHELDHALQDQHFDVGSLMARDQDPPSDQSLARLALLEGDASLLMTQWATQHMTPQELAETLQAAADPEQQALLARMPRILTEPLQWPYASGLQFVMQRWSSGGWRSVDALYARPPASTEQVLHPQKYASGEMPTEVGLPEDLANGMGAGWKVADTDTFGEYLVSVWLDVVGADAVAPTEAAEGWSGDTIAYLTGPGGKDAVVWRTAWDGDGDADEFETAAGDATQAISARTGGAATVVRSGPKEVTLVLASDRPTMDAAVRAAGLRPAG